MKASTVSLNDKPIVESHTIPSNTSKEYGHDLREIREILSRYRKKEIKFNKNIQNMTHSEMQNERTNLLNLSKQMKKIETKLKKDGIKWVVEHEKRMV